MRQSFAHRPAGDCPHGGLRLRGGFATGSCSSRFLPTFAVATLLGMGCRPSDGGLGVYLDSDIPCEAVGGVAWQVRLADLELEGTFVDRTRSARAPFALDRVPTEATLTATATREGNEVARAEVILHNIDHSSDRAILLVLRTECAAPSSGAACPPIDVEWGSLSDVVPSVTPCELCNYPIPIDDDGDGRTDESFDRRSDPEHCGVCGHSCEGYACRNGVCDCPPGEHEVGEGISARCESDSDTDCGRARAACTLQGLECIAGGRCGCPDGSADCDGDPTTACERLDGRSACGFCGASCEDTEYCAPDLDGVFRCSPDCADPARLCATNCVDTRTDSNHCGDCNRPCPRGIACVGGTCACPENEMPVLVPETPLEPAHIECRCGPEPDGTSCPGGQVCNGTRCACPSGEQLCGDPGRCVPFTVESCAGCMPCESGPHVRRVACVEPVEPEGVPQCRITCDAYFEDCDQVLATGCEHSISDPADCGACDASRVCAANECCRQHPITFLFGCTRRATFAECPETP